MNCPDTSNSDAKPFGTAKGERKAARKEKAIARELSEESGLLSEESELEGATEAAKWDLFYSRGQGTTYKDRHLLRALFPELVPESVAANPKAHCAPISSPQVEKSKVEVVCDLTLLEVGCGRGSSIFPLLRANPRLYIIGADFSAVAIQALREHPEYHGGVRVRAVVADITLPLNIEIDLGDDRGKLDYITAFWTLSALTLDGVHAALTNLDSLSSAGTLLCIRDFAKDDMREHIFKERPMEKSGLANVYRRGDGTIAAFFDEFQLAKILIGMKWSVVRCETVSRNVTNRKKKMVMKRKWIHAVFRKN